MNAAPELERWHTLLDRLNELSVTKHFDAYDDIDWNSPEFALDPEDPRFELPERIPLGGTDWYQRLPQPDRARLGCHLAAAKMKAGLVFESVLSRGLLEFAMTLPNRSTEFRYAYHEVIEESQHTLMFQEFVNRSGLDPAGPSASDRISSRWIIRLARTFPELFFLFVLGGEDPIDYVQRRELRSDRQLHPLLERIMRIHVTEEARHLSFARHYLKRNVPALSPFRRMQLATLAPVILSAMARKMLEASPDVVTAHHIPRDVLNSAYVHNRQHHEETIASLSKVRCLCDELGLRAWPYRLLWQRLGLEPRTAR